MDLTGSTRTRKGSSAPVPERPRGARARAAARGPATLSCKVRGGGSPPGRAWIGISGYAYAGWRGAFYPADLPLRGWLAYAAARFDSIELNGTFYSLKSPAVYARWAADVPTGYPLAVKGSRFITHNLKLGRAETALANFYASGVLALGDRTGPFLWQLPPRLRFDAARVERFLDLLPRDSHEAAQLARGHDARVRRGVLLEAPGRVAYRHAFEVRDPSFLCPAFTRLLAARGCALVVADTAGRHPYAEELTAGFVYVRLHGSREIYVSGYDDAELDGWAERIRAWRGGGRDVYVYFDNDAKVHAPHDALRLMDRVHGPVERRGT